MKIICTPSNGKLALIIDMKIGEIVREIEIPKEMQGEKNRPYGITKDSAGNWYISNWNKIGCFDGDFNFLYVMAGLPENIHQIQYDAASEELWVCATSIDSLLAINLKDKSARRFCLITNKWVALDAPGSDTQHFSSLRWHGSYLYVLAHKFGREKSTMHTFNRAMEPLGIWQAGLEAHSICEFNGHNYIVDSRGGAILGNNGICLPVNDPELYGQSNKRYARGMCINDRGGAVVAEFDFGHLSTRAYGDAHFHMFNVGDHDHVSATHIKGVGNIQDIQIFSEDSVRIPEHGDFYKTVIDALNPLVAPILAGEYFDDDDRMPYDPARRKPNLSYRLSILSQAPIDFAAQKNLRRLTKGIEIKAEEALNALLPQIWQRSGGFLYPAKNGFMDWHTNCETPGWRIYFVWSDGGSHFLTSEDGVRHKIKSECVGWTINIFYAGDKSRPFWHAVDSNGVNRISFGFKMRGA